MNFLPAKFCILIMVWFLPASRVSAFSPADQSNLRADHIANLYADSISGPALPLSETSLHSPFVDRAYHKLSRRQRIAQLFIVPAYSNKSQAFQDSIGALIKKYQPGGIIFLQGTPVKQVVLQNAYQDLLSVKALIAMDGEWGLGMRLDHTVSFPYQMSLGAIQNNKLISEMAGQIARDFRRMAMQVNFAPDIDINNNPDNSVINFRSFGEIRDNVADKGLAFIQGLQGGHVLATVKHFPGHGDTNVDSHLDLPVLPFSRQRLDSLELYPFRKLIAGGTGAVMIAHMHVPAIDSSKGTPTTLSGLAVNELLRTEMHFEGLVFTDAMNMLGLAKYYTPGEAAVKALQAGNDMVEMSPDLPAALKAVRKAVRHNKISRADLNLRCRKVLAYKEWAGLNRYIPADTASLLADLNTPAANNLVQLLSDSSLTILQTDPQVAGLLKNYSTGMAGTGLALLDLGAAGNTVFADSLQRAGTTTVFRLPVNSSQQSVDSVKKLLEAYPLVLVAVHDQRLRPASRLRYSLPLITLIDELSAKKTVPMVFFTNAYVLAQFSQLEGVPVLALTYQDSKFAELSAFNYFMGRLKSRGHLPVSILPVFHAGLGY